MRFRLIAAVFVALAGCSSSFDPASAVGAYRLTTYTYESNTTAPLDLLSQGDVFDLELRADGTTGGIFRSRGLPRVSPADTASMEGTYTMVKDVVHLQQNADNSFVRDLLYTANGQTLKARIVSDTSVVTIVLSKQ